VALTGGGGRRGAGGGGPAVGIVAGIPSGATDSSPGDIAGGAGSSGGTVATGGLGAAGGGTKTRGGVDLRNQHEVLPRDNARTKKSSRVLNIWHKGRELKAERGSPAQFACKVDSTIM